MGELAAPPVAVAPPLAPAEVTSDNTEVAKTTPRLSQPSVSHTRPRWNPFPRLTLPGLNRLCPLSREQVCTSENATIAAWCAPGAPQPSAASEDPSSVSCIGTSMMQDVGFMQRSCFSSFDDFGSVVGHFNEPLFRAPSQSSDSQREGHSSDAQFCLPVAQRDISRCGKLHRESAGNPGRAPCLPGSWQGWQREPEPPTGWLDESVCQSCIAEAMSPADSFVPMSERNSLCEEVIDERTVGVQVTARSIDAAAVGRRRLASIIKRSGAPEVLGTSDSASCTESLRGGADSQRSMFDGLQHLDVRSVDLLKMLEYPKPSASSQQEACTVASSSLCQLRPQSAQCRAVVGQHFSRAVASELAELELVWGVRHDKTQLADKVAMWLSHVAHRAEASFVLRALIQSQQSSKSGNSEKRVAELSLELALVEKRVSELRDLDVQLSSGGLGVDLDSSLHAARREVGEVHSGGDLRGEADLLQQSVQRFMLVERWLSELNSGVQVASQEAAGRMDTVASKGSHFPSGVPDPQGALLRLR